MISKELLISLEEELVARAATGEFLAFEELINLYTQPLWKYVFRALGNYEDANDTVQQILMQVYCSLPNLEDFTKFRSWLFMIARNKVIDHQRRKPHIPFADFGKEAPTGEDENEEFSPLQLFPDPAPLPQELIERRETQQLLRQAIDALPERSRQVVLMRYTTDLSFAEIGEALDMNGNTAKTLFLRAKNQLRYYLKQRL